MENKSNIYVSILDDEKEILEGIKSSIIENKETAISNLDTIKLCLSMIDADSKQIKIIEKAEQSVSDLLDGIVYCDNLEELAVLRKELNNVIRSVRKVLSKNEDCSFNYVEDSIKEVRDNISKLYRGLSRKSRIEEIEYLLSKEELSKDDKKDLTRLLRNEKSYIKRATIKKKKSSDKLDVKKLFTDFGKLSSDGDNEYFYMNIEHSANDDITYNQSESDEVNKYLMVYGVVRPLDYDGNIVQNVVSFFKNIPIYKSNKKAFERICFDYNVYSRSDGLEKVMDYLFDKSIGKDIFLFYKESVYKKINLKRRINENALYVDNILKNRVQETSVSWEKVYSYV